MRAAHLTAIFAVLITAATLVAGASSADVAPPKGLHGFMLRADEPLTTDFDRTPSFAWNPVPGAITLPVPDLDEQHVPRQRHPVQRRAA